MTDLQIIAEIISKYRQDRIQLLPSSKGISPNRYSDAYDLLFEGDAMDAEAKGNYLGMSKKSNLFRIFTFRFTETILDMLFFLDTGKTKLSRVKKAEYQCSRMKHQVLVLSLLNGRQPAIKIARKMLNISEKFGLAEYVIYSSGYLCTVAAESGENTLFEKYEVINEYWRDRMNAESKARILLEKIIVQYGRSVAHKPDLGKVAMEYAEAIKKDIQIHDCPNLRYYALKLEAIAMQILYNYEKSIATWTNMEQYFDKHPDFASDSRYAEIALQQMVCYMHLRNYKEGKKCAETCIIFFWEGSRNRLIFMEYYFLIAMQNGEYKKGSEILKDVFSNKNIEKMGATNRERWMLFNAYSTYASGSVIEIAEFDIDVFLEGFEKLQTDIKGYNVAIIILKWCMLLRKKDFDALYKISAAIKEYRLRNLKDRIDYRNNVFINMMQHAERLYYQTSEVENATAKLLRNMSAAKLNYSSNMEGLEIIPLDTLWLMAMKDMKKIGRLVKLKKDLIKGEQPNIDLPEVI